MRRSTLVYSVLALTLVAVVAITAGAVVGARKNSSAVTSSSALDAATSLRGANTTSPCGGNWSSSEDGMDNSEDSHDDKGRWDCANTSASAGNWSRSGGSGHGPKDELNHEENRDDDKDMSDNATTPTNTTAPVMADPGTVSKPSDEGGRA